MDPRLVPNDPKSQDFLPAYLKRSKTSAHRPTSCLKGRKKLRENIMGITKPSIRRLARRGGVVRMKHETYQEIRKVLRNRLEDILRIAIMVAEHPKHPGHVRKTVVVSDIIYALRKLGTPVYGFGDCRGFLP